MSFDRRRREFLTRELLLGIRRLLHGSQPADPQEIAGRADYFASFETCYPLLAEAGELLYEEAARHGIETKGRSREDIAREIFSRFETRSR